MSVGIGDWLEVGYIKVGSGSQHGDWAIYVDGSSVKNGSFGVTVGNWYWYEIEDIDNNGIWKIFATGTFRDSYNFAVYTGTPQAGLEMTSTSGATTEADIDQLKYYWLLYENWPSGNAVSHNPYNITECTEYHVKIKKNSVPTC